MEPKSLDSRATAIGSPPEVASELNNLLQIIGGTTDLLENIWHGSEGADRYLNMLRFSVERAARVTTQLVAQAGGASASVVFNPEPEAATQEMPAAKPSGPLVLVVDDERMTLELYGELLRSQGYEVVAADSPFKALDELTRRPGEFSLVLLDYSMPFMNGQEAFHRLREIAPGLPVILATGFVDQKILEGMFAAGLNAFICKPLPPDELLAHIAAVLSPADKSAEASYAGGIAAAL